MRHLDLSGARDVVHQSGVLNSPFMEISNHLCFDIPENEVCKQVARFCSLRKEAVLRCELRKDIGDARRKSEEPMPDVEDHSSIDRWKKLLDIDSNERSRPDVLFGVSPLAPPEDRIFDTTMQVHRIIHSL